MHAGIGETNTIQLHQIEYIKERLQERGREVSQGRVGLPESMEGKVEPVKGITTVQYLERGMENIVYYAVRSHNLL